MTASNTAHRTVLETSRSWPIPGPALADILRARHAHAFGTGSQPSLYLVHDRDGWDGTFAAILRRTLDDVLNADPARDPWEVSVIVETDDGTHETVAGRAVRFDTDAYNDHVVFTDGSTVNVDAIVALAV